MRKDREGKIIVVTRNRLCNLPLSPITAAQPHTLKMKLHAPFIITPRLMPGVQIGNAFISLGNGPRNSEGRTEYGCFIDLPGYSHEVTDLRSGCQGGDITEGMASLLSFLGAAADSYRCAGCDWDRITEDDNATLFPREVVEWAYQNSDEIYMIQMEIEESETAQIGANH